jgi:hypothetical protein
MTISKRKNHNIKRGNNKKSDPHQGGFHQSSKKAFFYSVKINSRKMHPETLLKSGSFTYIFFLQSKQEIGFRFDWFVPG